MPNEASTGNQPPSTWQAEALRITAFLGAAGSAPSADLWEQVIGTAPEKRLDLPRIKATEVVGSLGSGSLGLRITPARIDWSYSVQVNPDESSPPDWVIGDAEKCLAEFIPPMKEWLATCSHVQRLAYGAIFELQVPDQAEGYRQLDRLLGAVTIDLNASDFRYRINRPRTSKTTDFELRINRLAEWAVAAVELVQFNVGGSVQTRREPRTYACRLALDINTAADYGQDLPESILPQLLEELVSLGNEIALQGDVP